MKLLANPADLVQTIAWLRTSCQNSFAVRWDAVDDISEDLALRLEHLPPPASGGGAGGDLWRERHTYAALYFRRGPGFVVIKDRRSSKESAVYHLADPRMLDCFAMLDSPSEHACMTCAPLLAEDLVLRLGTRSILLPFRLRFPPIPFLAV